MNNEFLPTLGITIGDINGIGPEVIIKSLVDQTILKHCNIIIYGSSRHLTKYKQEIGFNDFQFLTIKEPKQAAQKKINLINCYEGDYFELHLGQIRPEAGKLAFQSLAKATEDLKNGFLEAIITAPISKDNIQSEEFKFPGHTEYLADAFGQDEALMFMVSEDLKMAVVTGHVPLEGVKKNITKKQIEKKLKLLIQSLKIDFNIQKPKIAVLGLNPHAGENGVLGSEEIELINPVLEEFKAKGELVFGPFPSDGFFGNVQWKKYDGVLAMYHDQGLTPFKMIAFDSGVNYTAGLPFIRTSPDHGTAFDIAGKNTADPGSMLNAIYYALDIWRKRTENEDLVHNAIKPMKIDRRAKRET
jgi:4-hydroxythreonine-4-phosphate dehydrogenase